MSRKKKHKTSIDLFNDVFRLLRESHRSVTIPAVAKRLGVPSQDVHRIWKILRELEKKGFVKRHGNGKFAFIKNSDMCEGPYRRRMSGSGIVTPENRNFHVQLNRLEARSLADGDIVSVEISKVSPGDRVKGRLRKVLSRRSNLIIGYYSKKKNAGVVHPLRSQTSPPVNVKYSGNIPDNHIVTVKLARTSGGRRIFGQIKRVLGPRNKFGVETAILIIKHDLRDAFPKTVLAEAEAVSKQFPESELSSRKDLRNEWTITVDPENARDFDDALSVRIRKNGYRLGVHIADVSHFVQPGSALDKEAYLRGTSVYFPERAVHMLPERLATDICSLNPHEDRLTMTVWIDLDSEGKILSGYCEPSVIHSNARLTYGDYLAATRGNPPAWMDEKTTRLCQTLAKICDLLLKQREARHVLDLDIPEPTFELDPDGKIVGIHKNIRSIAEKSIEEFMIAANVVVARFLDRSGIPFIRRKHDPPDIATINDLKESLRQLDITPPENPLDPEQIREMLGKISVPALRSVASYLILRALKRAIYTTQPGGHFGLALESYTQFTSPIRRYPDLEVHRAVKAALGLIPPPEYTPDELEHRAKWLSEREKKAQEAEWDAIKLQKIRFMQPLVGKAFKGTITHVEEFGAFVEIEEPFVEGLIPVYKLEKHFHHSGSALISDDGSIVLKPGKTIDVILEKADTDQAILDFALAPSASSPGRKTPRK